MTECTLSSSVSSSRSRVTGCSTSGLLEHSVQQFACTPQRIALRRNGIIRDVTLSEVVGPDAVHILFLEEMNTPAYWEKLGQITGLPVDTASMSNPETGLENVRSVAQAQWRLRPDERFKKTKIYQKSRGVRLVKRVIDAGYSRLISTDRGTIEMTRTLEQAIKSRFSDSNKRLSQRLGRSLPPNYL